MEHKLSLDGTIFSLGANLSPNKAIISLSGTIYPQIILLYLSVVKVFRTTFGLDARRILSLNIISFREFS